MRYERTISELTRMVKDAEELLSSLHRALSSLRGLAGSPQNLRVPHRRGRKSMGEDERKEVSRRMSNYWAQRRKQAKADARSVERNMRAV